MSRTAAQRANVLDSERSLSDQDVGLLYQIITRAEQNPDVERLPYRALFAAYDEVLAEHGGSEADPNQICMHFLFKMGTGGLANQPLFDKFEHALKEMGIALSFDDTASQITDSHEQYPAEQEPEVKARYVNRLEDTTQKSIRKRRASFNSIYDYGEDTTRKYGNRPSSRSSMSRLDPGKPDLIDTNDEPQFNPTPKNEAALLEKNELLAKFLEMGRQLMNGLNPATENQELPYRIPAVHVPKNGHRSSSPRPISRSESEIFRQWDQDQLNREKKDFNPINEEVLEILDPRPSLSDMLRDASNFSTYRKRVAARNILMYWLEQVIQMRQRNREMEAAALDQDRATLLRQALDLWRAELEKKRQNSRTKRFFRHLEKRAAKARDLYLMTKAFSHWAQLTSDELSKTSAARGHILSIKYFNAWREITAVNGMKAQRFATQGPLDGWRRKVQQIKMLNDQAIVTHERHLKQKYIFTLRLNFHLEHSAPAWNTYRLKRTSFLSWIRNLRRQREREVEIDFSLRQELLYATMRTWSYRLSSTNAAQQDADTTYRKKLLGEIFDIWSAQAKLQSAAVQTVTMCDTRRLRTSLARWRLRAEAVQQAKDADRLRVLRNAWTTWNDHLRCYALKERIDERLKKEAIYRWVLAERYRLAQRIREQRIQRETYAQFIFTVRDTSRALLQREYQYTRHYNKDLARWALDCWKNKFVLQRQREVAAEEFYIPRVEQEGLAIWTSKHNHLQNLDKWSKDARFYFVTTRVVKLWHNATLDACKRRRQEAYAKIRRKVKMNIAANVLRVWREKSHRTTNLHTQANELLQTKLLIRSAELFGIWRERFAKIVGDTQDAEVYYHRQLAYGQLVRWMDEFETLRGLEEQAEGLDMIRVSGVASALLRKLSLRLFQMRSAAEMAESLRDRILRKHHRNMLRNWIDVVRARRTQKEASVQPFVDVVAYPPVTPGPAIAGESKENTLDISQLGELPEFRLASTTPIATPGYLSSPSRRAARARMLSQMSTTPATPLFTPFATRLRAALDGEGYGTGNKSRSRRGSMGTIVRFAIEDPQSPTEGRKSSTRRD